jgi:hypothetical protein
MIVDRRSSIVHRRSSSIGDRLRSIVVRVRQSTIDGRSTIDRRSTPTRLSTLDSRPSTICAFIVFLSAATAGWPAAAQGQQLTIELKDFATMPVTGKLDGTGQTDGMLSRVNGLREEPGGARRVFINDMNGPLYIFDKATKTFTTYLDFNGRDTKPGIFHRLTYEAG